MGQCDDFLTECCLFIDTGQIHYLSNRKKNKDTLNLLQYSIPAMLQEIKELIGGDLYKGPVPDSDSKYPGDVWVFKKVIKGYPIYIKLKNKDFGDDGRLLLIMSFHIDE